MSPDDPISIPGYHREPDYKCQACGQLLIRRHTNGAGRQEGNWYPSFADKVWPSGEKKPYCKCISCARKYINEYHAKYREKKPIKASIPANMARTKLLSEYVYEAMSALGTDSYHSLDSIKNEVDKLYKRDEAPLPRRNIKAIMRHIIYNNHIKNKQYQPYRMGSGFWRLVPGYTPPQQPRKIGRPLKIPVVPSPAPGQSTLAVEKVEMKRASELLDGESIPERNQSKCYNCHETIYWDPTKLGKNGKMRPMAAYTGDEWHHCAKDPNYQKPKERVFLRMEELNDIRSTIDDKVEKATQKQFRRLAQVLSWMAEHPHGSIGMRILSPQEIAAKREQPK